MQILISNKIALYVKCLHSNTYYECKCKFKHLFLLGQKESIFTM